jgi:hypothetical protein
MVVFSRFLGLASSWHSCHGEYIIDKAFSNISMKNGV